MYYIPFSPLPKIANCGGVCASQLVLLRYKPRKDDDASFGFIHCSSDLESIAETLRLFQSILVVVQRLNRG